MTAKRTKQQVKATGGQALPLTVKEVVDIIGACRSANVSSFSFAGLSLTFEKTLDDDLDPVSEPVPPQGTNQSPTRRQTRPATPTRAELEASRKRLADIKVAEEEAKAEALIEARANELERLKVEDPLAYEDAIENGEVIL